MASVLQSQAHKRILVVDDLSVMANLWKSKFQQMGFDVDISNDGEEAMQALKERHFDAVLLDIYMPKKDGFSVLREKTTTQNSATPTFVVSSSIKQEDLAKATQLGAKRTFLKYQTSPKEVISALVTEMS